MSRLKGDEIVISGISGLFPEAENVQQLCENLYNKVDMVTKTNKYPHIKHPEFPQYQGEIKGTEKFDASFFRVTPKQAQSMDVITRKMMEHAFSALIDAGMSPEAIKNSRVGVYIAATQMDSVNECFYKATTNPFILSGCSKCMIANRISYWIDGKGPSYSIDDGCSGSMCALELAFQALKNGDIDSAIVGGSNYCMIPELTMNMKRAGLLCLDGKTKCFDKNGDGFVRSDAINVYFLQKARDAKRVYAEVRHVKGKYFASPDRLFTAKRNPKDIEQFLKEFYSEINVSPNDVEFVEANSFGIAESDGNELEAIGNVFAKNNNIKIGSIKSNIGNTESCSGACSVTKMCLAYQKGQIPANLHYSRPQNHIPAVKENKLQIVTQNEEFSRNYTAINNFCYTGSNFHALLKGHYVAKDKERYKSSIPRLVLVSSRKEEGVNKMLNILESNPIDPEQLALLNNIFKYNIPGYTGRGYTILDSNDFNETMSLSRGFEYISGQSRPVCFLYSGMGSQWAGMGEGLMRIPVFAAAIERCHKVLITKGLNIKEIITDKDSNNLNILNSLVAITAIQIGITDILKSIGINPDMIIGHSVGEIGSAYADGSLNMEEVILACYIRGIVTYETKFVKGKMAAVGLGHKQIADICPSDIAMACHNSSESTTLAGPSDDVSKFVKRLTDKGIFAKEVASYDIAFHSKYIAEAGPEILALLKKAIPNPKPRSDKWLSTCYLPEDWHKPEAKYASAEYITHNLMSSVLFEEAAALIPKDAIIIEIAPHGLLQAIMKRSHSECINLSLTKRGEMDGAAFLLKSIGKLYQFGLNPNLEALYPKVEFPVSTETPLLSHFITWDHEEDWKLNKDYGISKSPITKQFVFSILDDEYTFLKDHIRNGTLVLPEAAVIVYVWETLASFENKNYRNASVEFQSIQFHNHVEIPIEHVIRLEVTIQKGSRKFEVLLNEIVIADGIVNLYNSKTNKCGKILLSETEQFLSQNEIYTLLTLRGYNYEGEFQSIISSNINRNKASIKWTEQWITFLDSLIQLNILSNDHEGTSLVKFITNLTINVDEHKYSSEIANGVQFYNAAVNKETGVTQCDGVTFKDIICVDSPKTEIVLDVNRDLKVHKQGLSNKIEIDKNNKHVMLTATERNTTESLTWVVAPFKPSKSTIQIYYTGLSTKDCKKLSKSDNQYFGMDFSGLDVDGKRVMGLVAQGAMASTVEADYDLLWPVPQHWSLAEAATVPLPYIHAFYCLAIRQTVYKHYNILVIGAAGALGQAIISIALHLGCTVFGTVGNADKKRFLLKLFPELNEQNIGYTYDDTFMALIAKKTNNKRCNMVINTASGKIRENAMNCVGGDLLNNFFLDVNESDQSENKPFYMAFLVEEKSYKCVNVSTIFDENYSEYKKVLQLKLSEGIAKGYVKPLTSVVYSPSDVSRAFKLLFNRSNRGRVLISIKDIETSKQNLCQISRMVLLSHKTYAVVCDGTELGVELIHLLVQRGAKRLIIQCNPKTINGYFHVKYALWKECGATIEIFSESIQNEEKCQLFIDNANKIGPVDGVFIACSNFANKFEIFRKNQEDSSIIVKNLDKKTKNLRYFVVVADSNQDKIKDIEKCCIRHSNKGLTSLFLQYHKEDKGWSSKSLSTLFSGLETSLKQNFVSVSTSLVTNNSSETIGVPGNVKTNFNAGLKTFYQHVPEHEFDATEPIAQFKTTTSTGFEHELTLNPEDTYVIMLPGFDGNMKNLNGIAERLKKPAFALQMDFTSNNSIPDIAKALLKHVRARFNLKSPFFLVGYSFGVNIALEVAVLLEKEGLVGTVICIDSSPDALRTHLDSYLGNLPEEQLQDSLINHIYTLCTGHSSDDLVQKLKTVTKWSDKLDLFTNTVKTKVSFTHEYLRNVLQAAYHRIQLAKDYNPKFVLESELVLLKGVPHPNAKNLSNDYNLSLLTNKPVQVHDILSDHAMALKDCRISNFINRSLVF